MKIIRDRNEVLRRLKAAGTAGIPILCPNAETPDEMEGILLGARRHAESRELPRIVVGIGVTASWTIPSSGVLPAAGERRGAPWI